MKIHSIGQWSGNPALPTYLIQAEHKELMALGASNFQPGEQLLGLSRLIDIEDALSNYKQSFRHIALMPEIVDCVAKMQKSEGKEYKDAFARLVSLAEHCGLPKQ